MSNPTIDVHVGAPDPSWHPQTFTDACAFLDQLITAALNGPYIPYIISSSTPAVENQDKVWFKLDSSGRPLGYYFYYSGNWRRAYTGLPTEIRIFSGDPTLYFDTTGRGIVGGDWDGWAFMDGRNGTTDISDHFIIVGHLNESGGVPKFDSGWQTNVTGTVLNHGGSPVNTLHPDKIPIEAKDALVVDKWKADGNARDDTGQLFGAHSTGTADTGRVTLIPAVEAQEASAFSIVPPFFAAAYCKFVGYL